MYGWWPLPRLLLPGLASIGFGLPVTQHRALPAGCPLILLITCRCALSTRANKMWCKIAHNYLVSGNIGPMPYCSSVIMLAFVKPHLSTLLRIILTNEAHHVLLGLTSLPSWCWQKKLCRLGFTRAGEGRRKKPTLLAFISVTSVRRSLEGPLF